MALNGGMRMEYSHAVSFKIDCADQAEVDRLWDTLIANGGQAERCGWLKDRYGLSWQIVPTTLPKYLGGSCKSTPASAGFVVAFAEPQSFKAGVSVFNSPENRIGDRAFDPGASSPTKQSARYGSLTRWLDQQDSPVVDTNGLPVRLALKPGEAHDNRLCSDLLSTLLPRTMLLADRELVLDANDPLSAHLRGEPNRYQ
jgi:hypothetical protein